jgi:myosin heavy subunit
MASRKSNQRFIAWSIVAIVLLLATNAYQWWNNLQLNKSLELHKQELAAVEQMQGQLEKDYDLALSSLEELKGDNKELNELIEQQKAELKSQKDRISNLIWKTKKLDEAKKEIENLKNQALAYVDEINQLKAENVGLLAENTELKTQTITLQSRIEVISTEKDSLNKEKDSIVMVKEALMKENQVLNIKATKASVIEVQDIEINGFLIRDNGDLRRARKAKNVQLLQICFKMLPNEIADNQTEDFYIRILSPTGETLFKKQLGAGIFRKTADGSESKYTLSASYNMPMSEEQVCANYEHKETINEGIYAVEIYNKGYLTGQSTFKLR